MYQVTIESVRIHPLGTTNSWTKAHGDPSKGFLSENKVFWWLTWLELTSSAWTMSRNGSSVMLMFLSFSETDSVTEISRFPHEMSQEAAGGKIIHLTSQ